MRSNVKNAARNTRRCRASKGLDVAVARAETSARAARSGPADDVLDVGDFKIDRERYSVIKNSKKFSLPRKEFELLFLLVSNIDKVMNRDKIMNQVWGSNVLVGDRTIDVHIRKLREKFGNEYFKTIKGVGYKFEVN